MEKDQVRCRLPYKTDQQKDYLLDFMERLREDIKINGVENVLSSLGVLQSCQSENVKKWLVLSDVHRPFHDKVLWDKVLRLIRDMGESLYGIVLAGDYLDLYTLGSYNEQSLGLLRDIDLDFEYRDGLDGIIEIESAAKYVKKKVFMYGNHEDRYFRTLNSRDNAKFGAALKNPIEALGLNERGWIVTQAWKDDFYTIGNDLDIIHGVFHNKHCAAKHLDANGRSVMFGHTHRVQSFTLGDDVAYNIGGLFDLENKAFGYMARMQRRSWSNGFAIVNVADDGSTFVNQIDIKRSKKFYAEGKIY